MKKYEYKLLTIETGHFRRSKFQQELDYKFQVWGEDGWELVKMEPIKSGGFFNTQQLFIVFKREKQA